MAESLHGGVERRFHSFVRQKTASTAGRAHAVMDVWNAVVVPEAALVLVNIVAYSGLASFWMRARTDARMPVVFCAVVVGLLAGGAFFPRIKAWAEQPASAAGRLATAAWLLIPLVAVIPGFRQYLTNEPLRAVGNFSMGLAIASSYHLFFKRFPQARRGVAFGAATGAGLLCWSLLMALAQAVPVQEDASFHPFLPHVYIVHAAAVVALAAVSLYAMALGAGRTAAPDRSESRPDAESPKAALLRIAALFGVFFLSGVLQSRMTPAIPVATLLSVRFAVSLLAAVAAPAAGYLLDRNPRRFANLVVPACCWLFLLAPSLVALGREHHLHRLLQPLTAAAQITLFVAFTVRLADTTSSLPRIVWYACCLFAVRLATVPGYLLWGKHADGEPGVTVFIGTLLAAAVFLLIRKADALSNEAEAEPPVHAVPPDAEGNTEIPAASLPPVENDAVTAFLARVELTQREAAAARLLLGGHRNKSIAKTLGLAERTVKKHVTGVLRKFGVDNRRSLSAAYLDSIAGGRERPDNHDHLSGEMEPEV